MVDPLLRQIIKVAIAAKIKRVQATTHEFLSVVEQLTSLLYVQAAEARVTLLMAGSAIQAGGIHGLPRRSVAQLTPHVAI